MAGDNGDEDEWRFSLEDLETDSEADEVAGEGEDGTDGGGNVAGSMTPRGEIEPGTIDPENAFFVLLGAVLTTLLVFNAARFALGL